MTTTDAPDTPETKPEPAAETAMVERKTSTQAVAFAMAPRNMAEGLKLAEVLAKSTLVPDGFKGKPGDIYLAMQMGAEIGMLPATALQSIYVVNGRPSLWGDALPALIMRSGELEQFKETFDVDEKQVVVAAVCVIKRKGFDAVTQRFSKADAVKADLWTKKGPWQNYPDRMLKMRARSWAIRDTFPDILKGLAVAEEAMDIPVHETRQVDAVVVEDGGQGDLDIYLMDAPEDVQKAIRAAFETYKPTNGQIIAAKKRYKDNYSGFLAAISPKVDKPAEVKTGTQVAEEQKAEPKPKEQGRQAMAPKPVLTGDADVDTL